jgi:hypothetical protein
MRNLRRTRKKGGLSVTTVLECVGPIENIHKCEAEFLKEYNFIRIKIPGDGNCFYRALSKYYELSNPPELGKSRFPTHQQLRKRVVDVMEANIEDVIVGLIIENESPEEALNDLRKDGNWNSDNADVVSQFAAKALNIRINIFDKKEAVESKRTMYSKEKKANGTEEKKYRIDPAQPAKIIRYAFEPEGFVGVETINLLRVGNSHYELLYPNAAPVALPKGRRITAKKANGAAGKKVNLINNTTSKFAAFQLTNKKMNTAKKNNKSGMMTRSRAKANKPRSPSPVKERRSSLENALKLIVNLEKRETAASKRAKTIAAKKAQASKRNNIENDLLKIALQESEEQAKKDEQSRKNKQKKLNNNFFAALEHASFDSK